MGCLTGQAAAWRLSTAGFGDIPIGARVADAARLLNAKLVVDGEKLTPACYYVRPEPPIKGLTMMVSNARIVRFDVTEPGIRTPSGIAVGDPETTVIKRLGTAVKVTPHHYLAPAGHYLTVWSSDHRTAVRFETHAGTITAFYAGLASAVMQVEGCA